METVTKFLNVEIVEYKPFGPVYLPVQCRECSYSYGELVRFVRNPDGAEFGVMVNDMEGHADRIGVDIPLCFDFQSIVEKRVNPDKKCPFRKPFLNVNIEMRLEI